VRDKLVDNGITDPEELKKNIIRIMSYYQFKHDHDSDWTLPGHNYAGPGTAVVDNLVNGVRPINNFDHAALHHDVDYLLSNSVSDIKTADSQMIDDLNSNLLNGVMKVKSTLGFDNSFVSNLSENEKILVKTLFDLREHEWYGDKVDVKEVNKVIDKLRPQFLTS